MDKFLWDNCVYFSPMHILQQISLGPLHLLSPMYILRTSDASPPQFNVGHHLVHVQSCTLFFLRFPQATLNGEGEGVAKEPWTCDKKCTCRTLFGAVSFLSSMPNNAAKFSFLVFCWQWQPPAVKWIFHSLPFHENHLCKASKSTLGLFSSMRPTWNNCKILHLVQNSISKGHFCCSSSSNFLNSLLLRQGSTAQQFMFVRGSLLLIKCLTYTVMCIATCKFQCSIMFSFWVYFVFFMISLGIEPINKTIIQQIHLQTE